MGLVRRCGIGRQRKASRCEGERRHKELEFLDLAHDGTGALFFVAGVVARGVAMSIHFLGLDCFQNRRAHA